jgi:hypothetical protein
LQLGAFTLEVGFADLKAALERTLEFEVEFAAFGHKLAFDKVPFAGFSGHGWGNGLCRQVESVGAGIIVVLPKNAST